MSQPLGLAGAPAPELSVVIPTRNEAENVPALLGRLSEALAPVDFELVFVDDSDDATSGLLARAAERDSRVRCLHRSPEGRHGGLSTAVLLGLGEARGRLLCVMDADLQHPPETIPRLLRAELEGADLVVASRYLKGGSRQGLGGGGRQLVSRLASLLVRALFPEARRSTDPLAGFFVCRSALLRGLEFRPVGFKILLELLVCSPHPVVSEVPLVFQPRAGGESKANLGQGLLFLRHVWSLLRDVPGSARAWKFAAVGVSGFLLFLLLLEAVGTVIGWPALAAWAIAFVGSALWNYRWNLWLTFADLRRERYPLMRRYISSALTAGGSQLIVFLGLVGTDLPLVLDGVIAALVGMTVNGALNWQLARRHRQLSQAPVGVERFLSQLARAGGAQWVGLLDDEGALTSSFGQSPRAAAEQLRPLLERSRRAGLPLLWTEPPSNRPQARTNVELASAMVLPIERPGQGRLTALMLRHARAPFDQADLDAVMRRMERLLPRLSWRSGETAGREEEPVAAQLSGSRGPTGRGEALGRG